MAEVKYPDNSDASKLQEQKKEQIKPPVLKGEVVQKKKHKLKDAFISEDIVDVKDYIFMDVFVPALKKLIEDILTNGIRALFYGNTNAGKSSISYLTPYDKMSSKGSIKPYSRPVQMYDLINIVFSEKRDAQDTLDTMIEICERYGKVSVADLYQIVRRPTNANDFGWGWTDLRSAKVVYGRSGYMLDLPKVISIDK